MLLGVKHSCNLGECILLVDLSESGDVQAGSLHDMRHAVLERQVHAQAVAMLLQQLSLVTDMHRHVGQRHLEEVSVEIHEVLGELVVNQLRVQSLLDPQRVRGVALSLDQVQLVVSVPLKLRVLEHLVRTALALRFVEVVHVELPYKG